MPLVARGGSLLVGSDGKLTTNEDCCCGPVCDDYDCSDYDLAECECIDFATGTLRVRSNVLLHITGGTNGGDSRPIETIPSQVLPSVDYSGTYAFPAIAAGGGCGHDGNSLHLIQSQFLGTVSGGDWFAILFVWPSLGYYLVSAIALCEIGVVPDSNGFDADFRLWDEMERWELAFSLSPACGLNCLCPSNPTGTLSLGYESLGAYGHGLDGAGGPSGTYEIAY